MSRARFLLLSLILGVLATPAAAQFSDSYNFLKAVRERDAVKVRSIVDQPGSTIVNTRENGSGDTALHMVTRGRDLVWINFLLSMGANVDARDRQGATPLVIAAELGFADGIRLLLGRGAKVNAANQSGETALIKAVQTRDAASARLLLEAGASPDQTDNVAGLSARDYATRDRRAAAIVRLIDEVGKSKAAKAAGPAL